MSETDQALAEVITNISTMLSDIQVEYSDQLMQAVGTSIQYHSIMSISMYVLVLIVSIVIGIWVHINVNISYKGDSPPAKDEMPKMVLVGLGWILPGGFIIAQILNLYNIKLWFGAFGKFDVYFAYIALEKAGIIY